MTRLEKYRREFEDSFKQEMQKPCSCCGDPKGDIGKDDLCNDCNSTFRLASRRVIQGKVSHAKRGGKAATLTMEEWKSIIVHQRNRCKICNRKFSLRLTATLDHIVAVTKKGELTKGNVQALCGLCNLRKSNKDMEDVAVGGLYEDYQPE